MLKKEMHRLITLGHFPLNHSTQVFRISTVLYADPINSEASGHAIIQQKRDILDS